MTFDCYKHKRDTYFNKLDYRDLWFAVDSMIQANNDWKYEQLMDANKNYLKTIFQQIGEELPTDIESVKSNSQRLTVITKNERYRFNWEYDKINYTKEYGGKITLPNFIVQC